MVIMLIYTQTDKWLLTRQNIAYQHWERKLYWFKTSLSFESVDACLSFLKDEYGLSSMDVQDLVDSLRVSKDHTWEIAIHANKTLSLNSLQMNLMDVEGEVIDWEDWFYLFRKHLEELKLWVYLGGIAEQVREISLSVSQQAGWQEKGNEYIRTLAEDMRFLHSKVYQEAIAENRNIL